MKILKQIINGVYDFYGENTSTPIDGNYTLKSSTQDVVYLQEKGHWDLTVVAVDDFNKYFRLRDD